MKQYFILLILISNYLSAQTIEHIKGSVFSLEKTGNVSLARGQSLNDFERINLTQNSQIHIAWENNSTLEIIGPASLSKRNNTYFLEQGRFLFFSSSRFPIQIQIFDEIIRPSRTALEVEIPSNRQYAQLLILDRPLSIAGELLESKRLYILESGRIQKGISNPSFATERRKDYPFSGLKFRDLDEKAVFVSLRNQIVLRQSADLIKVKSSEEIFNFVQNTFGFGLSVEWSHKRYFRLPQRPQRIHYLRAPALILSSGVNYASQKVQASPSVGENSQFLGAHAGLGVSWLALSISAIGNYISGDNTFYQMSSPLSYGIRAHYEWDLLEFSANDIMLSLGYSYSVSKLKAKAELSTPATGKSFNLVQHRLLLGFHINF